MRIKKKVFKRYVWLLVIFNVYIAYGVYNYRPWKQIIDVADNNPFVLIAQSHPHAWRLFAVYPGLVLNDILNGEFGFGFYTAFIGFLAYLLWHKIGELIVCKNLEFASLIFIVILALMNGRGVFAWFAWMLCIFICMNFSLSQRIGFRLIISIPISLLFSTVSSGVFFVVFMGFLVFFSFKLLTSKVKRLYKILVSILSIALVYRLGLDYLLISTQKNLSYYDLEQLDIKGLIILAQHGVGLLFEFYWFQLLFPIIIFGLLTLALWLWKQKKRIKEFPLFIFISLTGGVFGFTTLTLTLPLLLLLNFFPTWRFKKR